MKEEKIVRVSRKGYVQVSDLDECVGADDIVDRMVEVLGVDSCEVRVTSIGKVGVNRRAIVRLSLEAARELADVGILKVGFVASRVVLREFADRCYSCGATGHFAGTCKVEDRRGKCFRCGKEGHLARNCGKG